MLVRGAQFPPIAVCRYGVGLQRSFTHSPRQALQGPKSPFRHIVPLKALPDDGKKLGALSEEIQRRQKIIDEQLAELKEITGRLTPEEQKALVEVIKEKDAEIQEQTMQGGEQDYPPPVRDILEAAGVLNALPFDPEPVLAQGSRLPIPKPLSYEWSDEDFVDDGRELTDDEWSEFFQTQLKSIREEAGGDLDEDECDPDDPYHGLPDPFDEDLSMPGDDIIFEPGEGVEEYLQLLETGKPLPPSPREVGRPKESAQSFLRRMDKLQARYNAQFLKRKDWQISPEEVKALDAQWEELAMRSDMPVTMDDIQEVTPAPDIPPEVERQFKRVEWVLYRLRRAYLEGIPSQPVQALASAGLLAENAIYRDIVVECRGLPAVMEYANRVDWTCGNVELCQIWGHMSEHRPVPEWYVMVDSWLNIPYPEWYVQYVQVHFQATAFPDAFMAAFANATMAEHGELDKVFEGYREWSDRVKGVPHNRRERKQLENPVLMRDAYEGRAFTKQQRMRSGTLPVLESRPDVTVDETEAHGTPDDMLRDPFLETSLIDFVTDPEKAKPRFAGVATDPYGSGRHLLLPMFRRMQHEGSWIINLTEQYKMQPASSEAAQHALAASRQPSTSSRLNGSRHAALCEPVNTSVAADSGRTAAAVAAAAAAQLAALSEHAQGPAQAGPVETSSRASDLDSAEHSDDILSEESAEKSYGASETGPSRYRVSKEDALEASQHIAREWAAGRLSLDYPPEEDENAQTTVDDTSVKQSSMQEIPSAALLRSVLSTIQEVKPGVFVASELPAGWDAAVLGELSQRQRTGDDEAAKALTALRCRGISAGRERPKPEMPKPWQQALAAAAGRPFDPHEPSRTVQPPLESWRHRSNVTGPASSPAVGASEEYTPGAGRASPVQGFVDSVLAARSTDSSITGSDLSPVSLWRKWRIRLISAQRRKHAAMKALPPLKRLQAGSLHIVSETARSNSAQLRRVSTVVEAVSSFQGSLKSKSELDHTFRMLAYAPATQNPAHTRTQQSGSKDTSSKSSPEANQKGKPMPHRQPVSNLREAEIEPVISDKHPLSSAAPVREKRLTFQMGSGFVSESRNTTKQGSIPDLIGLMCSPSSDSVTSNTEPIKTYSTGDDEAEAAGSEDLSQREGKMPGKAEGGPRKRPIGTAWRDGSHMTIPMTTMYELNPATGQVDRITSHWNGYIMHGLEGAEQEAWDIYIRQTRFHELMGKAGYSVRFIRRDTGTIDPEVALDL